jgi:N-acetyl-gamma-glutamyl-phosphate reductase
MAKIKVAVVGATGFAGEELVKILLGHPDCQISYICAKIDKPQRFYEIFPWAKGRCELVCDNPDLERLKNEAEVVFLAVPHKTSMDITPVIIAAGKICIDLSADYRLKDKAVYEKWYAVTHKDPVNLKKAVYGLPELYKSQIEKSRFVANPGCYPTAAILAIAPIFKEKVFFPRDIIIDTKSGYSGAGRKAEDDPFWKSLKDNFKAYKVDSHQHSPEIDQELSFVAGKPIKVTFVPHLLPVERGILETIYLTAADIKVKTKDLAELYKRFYKAAPFVRIKDEGEFPQLSDIQNTNFCDIGFKVNASKGLVIIIAAIDNLVKGAAGQAVQNMNIICGFKETAGLL